MSSSLLPDLISYTVKSTSPYLLNKLDTPGMPLNAAIAFYFLVPYFYFFSNLSKNLWYFFILSINYMFFYIDTNIISIRYTTGITFERREIDFNVNEIYMNTLVLTSNCPLRLSFIWILISSFWSSRDNCAWPYAASSYCCSLKYDSGSWPMVCKYFVNSCTWSFYCSLCSYGELCIWQPPWPCSCYSNYGGWLTGVWACNYWRGDGVLAKPPTEPISELSTGVDCYKLVRF